MHRAALQHSDCCLTREQNPAYPAAGGDTGLHPSCAALERSDQISAGEKPTYLLHLKCLGCKNQNHKPKGVFKRFEKVTLQEPSGALWVNFPTLDPSLPDSVCHLPIQPSLSITVLSWVSFSPALSPPQMFSLLNKFIPFNLKRASPRFHLCLHSVRGKFLLRADLFLLSKETRLSIDSDGKAEQEISEPALTWKLCYLPARGQTPPPAKGTRTWPRATADTSVLRSGSPAHPAAQITQHRYSGC